MNLKITQGSRSFIRQQYWFVVTLLVLVPAAMIPLVSFAWDASIPKTQNTLLAEKVLDSNLGNILTPEMTNSLSSLTKPIGWEFGMVHSRQKTLGYVFRLEKMIGNEYYFEYFNSISSNPRIDKYKWVNGYRYYAKNNTNKNNPSEYGIGDEEKCKFTLGLCEYKSYSGISQKQYTEFRRGVWIYKQTGLISDKGDLVKCIYDASGLPLYRYYTSLETGGTIEEQRLER